jgi:hypothetical protein
MTSEKCDFCGKTVLCDSDSKVALMYDDIALVEFEIKIGFTHKNPPSREDNKGQPLFFACPYCLEKYLK